MSTPLVPPGTRPPTEALPPDPNAEAYEATTAAAEALPPEQLRVYNLDAAHAYAATLCTAERCEFLRSILARTPTFELAHLDALPRLGRALAYAHAKVCNEPLADDGLAEMLQQSIAVRARMQSAADNMVSFELADADVVQAYRAASGYRGTVEVLSSMIELIHSKWTQLEGRTLLTAAHVAQATALRDTMAAALGDREQVATEQDLWIERRRRVATLLCIAHDEVRDAVRYLRRHEGDGDTLAPTLVIVGSRKASDAPPQAPAASTPVAPAPVAPAPALRNFAIEEPPERPFEVKPATAPAAAAAPAPQPGSRPAKRSR